MRVAFGKNAWESARFLDTNAKKMSKTDIDFFQRICIIKLRKSEEEIIL